MSSEQNKRRVCTDVCKSGPYTGTACSLYEICPPNGYKTITPRCYKHCPKQELIKYDEELLELVRTYPDIQCVMCQGPLKEMYPHCLGKVVKTSCCKQFMCIPCLDSLAENRQFRYNCIHCKEPNNVDRRSPEYLSHKAKVVDDTSATIDFVKERDKIKQLFINQLDIFLDKQQVKLQSLDDTLKQLESEFGNLPATVEMIAEHVFYKTEVLCRKKMYDSAIIRFELHYPVEIFKLIE